MMHITQNANIVTQLFLFINLLNLKNSNQNRIFLHNDQFCLQKFHQDSDTTSTVYTINSYLMQIL